MIYSRSLIAAAVWLTGGCAPSVSGIVRDAETERPIGGAVVELRESGWGFRNNRLVWDVEKISRATTDRVGHFRLGGGGGHGLRVAAPELPVVNTGLCSRSPMIIRVGGPYAHIETDKRILFRPESPATRDGYATSYRAMVDDVAIRASGRALAEGDDLRIETEGGVRFVAGTGAIPIPPPMPYDRLVNLDLRSDCGWLFVSNGTAPVAVIQVGSSGWEQEPGRPRAWVMMYSPLSDR